MREFAKTGSVFVYLSDPDAKMAAQYAGRERGTVLKPAVFVVGKGKKITFASVEQDPSASDVLKAVRDTGFRR